MKRRGQDPHSTMRELLRERSLLVVGVVLLAVLAPVAVASLRSPGSLPTVQRADGPGRTMQGEPGNITKPRAAMAVRGKLPKRAVRSSPSVLRLRKAQGAVMDVRTLKSVVVKRERPEHRAPGVAREAGEAATANPSAALPAAISPSTSAAGSLGSPAPAPDISFEGLDFANWGAGHPPDTNGDVGPSYYIQTINTSIGIYDKSNGNRVAAFTFDAFMSQGNFGNLCDTDNFGDPVVIYDSFEDRWIITDFAFKLDGSGNVSPQHVFECFAASKTGDPVSGGWNFYSIETPGGLGDYPKFGIWPDGLYMSANMFGYSATASFIAPRVWAIDKAQMYAGEPTVQVADFEAPAEDFTLLPANARLQAGTPPPGTPEYFVSTWEFLNGVTVYKLHVDWDKISTSTFAGPDVPLNATSWPNASVGNAPTPGNSLDTLEIRAMAQLQYSNISGSESLWASHTVRRANTSGSAAPRWYQLNVSGGTVAANTVQGTTWDPDGANTFHRFMPSLAIDRNGDMALGYSKSNATTNPQIKYAGRLAGDPVNTFSQTEQTLIDGTGTQTGNCGSTCTRWGDYSGMSLDPDGCTFWETNEYYAVNGLDHHTRIGSFKFPGCTTVGDGTLSGTVTDGSTPVAGATVALGSRTTTTNGSGAYSFSVPAGTYLTLTATKAGFDPASASSIAVPDGGTATRNFTLNAAAASGCFADNTQNAFQRGIPNGCDLTSSPGSVILANPDNVDQENSDVNPTGFGISTTNWAGQTFTPAVTGKLVRVDVELFCSACSGTNPDITVSLRATTGATPVPTGADLATATLPGFNDGAAGGLKTVTFNTPATVTAGTRYAFVFRAIAARTGTYAYTCSCATTGFFNSNPYANGQRVTSTNSGSTWTADTTVGGRDLNFKTYINSGFAPSGTLVSSVKDANPAAGHTAHWTTLSFTATKPATTDVKFQVAASNSSYGPFNFVGPDGTAATFFTTSGASLSQFNGFRYLRYEAYLSSGDGSVTPALSAVTVCFNDNSGTTATSLAVGSATGTYGGTTNVAATLTAAGNGVSGETVDFALNGNSVGSAVTNASGVATLSNVSLSAISAGLYPAGVAASFAGDSTYDPNTASNSLTIGKADQTIAVTAHALANATYATSFAVAATGGGSGNPVTFSNGGVCTNLAGTFTMTSGTGICTVKYDQAGNANYNAAPQVTETVNAQKASQSISFGSLAAKTFGAADFMVSASTPSGLVVSFAGSGNCTMSGATVHITGAGSCTVTASQAGNANYEAAPAVAQTFAIAKAAQSITFGTFTSKTWGDPDFTVTATSTSGLAVAFAAAGPCTVSGAVVHLTGAGSCLVTASQSGDANYEAALPHAQLIAVAKANQAITFGALANKTLGDPDFVVSPTASSGLPISFTFIGGCTLSGTTVHLVAAGSCAITASQSGDANYNVAAEVSQSFTIAARPVTVTPTKCRVPNVVGKTLTAAKLALKQKHCRTGKVSRAYSKKTKKGRVSSQSRRPGRVLANGTKVNLVVSRGRRP